MKYAFALVLAVVLAVPAYAGGGVGLGPLQARRLNNQKFRQDLRVDRAALVVPQSHGARVQQIRVHQPAPALLIQQHAPQSLLLQQRTIIIR